MAASKAVRVRKLAYAPRPNHWVHRPGGRAKLQAQLKKGAAISVARRHERKTAELAEQVLPRLPGDTLRVGVPVPPWMVGYDVALYLSHPPGLWVFNRFCRAAWTPAMKDTGFPIVLKHASKVDEDPEGVLKDIYEAAEGIYLIAQDTSIDPRTRGVMYEKFAELQARQVRVAKDIKLLMKGPSEAQWNRIKASITKLVQNHPELQKEIMLAIEG